MKRQILKSISAFCMGVMTLVAASSLVVSCNDKLWNELEDVKGQLSELDKKIEEIKTQLEELASRVDALYTLQFQASDSNELQYSFDGGQTWKGTGINLAEERPEVSLVDNGDSVTITVGDQSYTIEKPEEIVFEIRAGKVYFESEGTVAVNIKSEGIEDITVMSAPKGWWAEITSDGKVEITAPDYESTQGTMDYDTWEEIPGENAASGYVKVHACGADGKCMVGKVAVELTNSPLVVAAYDGKAYFTVAGTSSWPPTFYYGVSTKDGLEADTKDLIDRINDDDWSVGEDYPNNWGEEFEVEESIADLLGEEPKLGEEYVVWALIDSHEMITVNDLVYTYYSPLQVNVTEVEEEKTAYNVTVNVEVVGADQYVAVAIPGPNISEDRSLESYAEDMAMSLVMGTYYGKLYTDSYSGSALDIAEGTTFYMGSYAPAMDLYVLILPIDGRPVEAYTAENVVVTKFTTAGLAAGGSINLTAKQVTEYMGLGYDENWNPIEKLLKLDPYTELGVEVTPSSTTDWVAFYYQFLTEAQWAGVGEHTEDIVDLLLEGWGMTPSDIKSWPQYPVEKVSPATTLHFVGFIVDKDGKYGELAHVELTSKELVKADFAWVDPIKTNVVDDILKNTTTLEFTPEFEEGVEAAQYKYVLTQTTYYNPYENLDDAQMAEELYLSTSTSVKTISADELVNGVLYVTGHSYGYQYYFAIVPIDADGNPGASAAILEYETVFELPEVITSGADFEATRPTVELRLPADDECYPDYGYGDDAYYGYAYSDYDGMYNFYYEIGYNVTPKEGTEVCSVIADLETYTLGATDAETAGKAWSGSYGSWKTSITTEKFESALTYCNHYENQPAPDLVLVVSWKDAEGNYYYESYPLQEKMQYYADKMKQMISEGNYETPDGNQLTFTWDEMMGAPSVLDFGVTTPGKLAVAYDLLAVYGEDAGIPEEMRWMQYVAWDYEVTATDATSGVITISSFDMYGDVQTSEGSYSEWDGETCVVNFEMLMLENVTMTVSDELIPVYIEQGGMIM